MITLRTKVIIASSVLLIGGSALAASYVTVVNDPVPATVMEQPQVPPSDSVTTSPSADPIPVSDPAPVADPTLSPTPASAVEPTPTPDPTPAVAPTAPAASNIIDYPGHQTVTVTN